MCVGGGAVGDGSPVRGPRGASPSHSRLNEFYCRSPAARLTETPLRPHHILTTFVSIQTTTTLRVTQVVPISGGEQNVLDSPCGVRPDKIRGGIKVTELRRAISRTVGRWAHRTVGPDTRR